MFDRSSVAANVDIDKGFDPVEIIQVNTGSGLTVGQDATLSAIKVVVDAIQAVTDWMFRWAQADEEKNVQTNKYYKRDKDTQQVLIEKDYAKDGNDNETLTQP